MKKMSTENDILAELYTVVRSRCSTPSASSYVTALLQAGPDALHAKIAEEASELAGASASKDRTSIIHEAADLWFHCMVLLGHHGIHPREIYEELRQRRGISGLAEKAGRGGNHGVSGG